MIKGKKYFVLSVLLSAFCLTACGNTSTSVESSTAPAATEVSATTSEEPAAETSTTEDAADESSIQSMAAESGIKNVTTVNHSYGDGQKVSNVILEYADSIDASSLSTDSFEVKDRTITNVYTNSECKVANAGTEGNFVVLNLEIQDPLLDDSYATDGRMQNNQVIDSATVVQTKDILTTSGDTITASPQEVTSSAGDGGIMGNTAVQTPDLDVFEDNHYYDDPSTGEVLHYNFYAPEGYETSGKTYPLVLFIPDASAVGSDWETVLQQGNGGTIWASEDWQAGNPCFIVTMIYQDKYINDYWEYYGSYMNGTMSLLYDLMDEYPIDRDRVYTTGQSMGCMASMVMMEKDPDLFAAAYIVAGQWDPEGVKDTKDQNILFMVSEDDPAIQKATLDVEKWQEKGGTVAIGSVTGIAPDEEQEASVTDLLDQDANIYFLKIASGTGSMDIDGNPLPGSHRMTFRLAYDLPCAKEWLFKQIK